MTLHWRKSSYTSTNTCVEVAWRRSRFSSAETCVELAEDNDAILVRNSNHPDAGTLTFSPDVMAALIGDVKAGRLDHLA